jgi:hypothetical protein
MADEEHLRGASLLHANLTHASLRAADLRECRLVDTNIDGADFERALVHGASIWGLIGVPARQDNLVISSSDDAQVTVDDLEVAQFIYLLLNREKLRSVIQTMTSRAVLILGRFTPERKVILDALANEVRKHKLLPIVFDFERATTRDFTETIKVLAGLSAFVIADITDPKSVRYEERVKAGKATINGFSIADRKKNLQLAKEIVAFRTATTVEAINKSIANKGTLPAPPRVPRP